MSRITEMLHAVADGRPHAANQLILLVYDELRNLAAARVARERVGHSLQPTELVNEAYLRLLGPNQQLTFENRRHFFAAAAQAMRRILIDHARRRQSIKRGGQLQRVELSDQICIAPDEQALALDDALNRLTQEDAQAARVVELRQFAGLSHEQVAAAMGLSVYQVRQKWTYARAWLKQALSD